MMDPKELEKEIAASSEGIPVQFDDYSDLKGVEQEEEEEKEMTEQEMAETLQRQRIAATQQDVQILRLRIEKIERMSEHTNKILQTMCKKMGITIPDLR